MKNKLTNNVGLPTTTDVARLAGVSQSAVSRAFREGTSVSPKMRDRVLAAAEQLGYRPNIIPRIMATGRSGMVAVIAGGFYNPFFNDMLEVLLEELREAGLQAILVHARSDQALDSAINEIVKYRVDAIITPLAIKSEAVANRLHQLRLPVVTLNVGITGGLIRAVTSDSIAASAAAAALLHRRGGRRFGYIGGPDSPQQNRREQGFAEGLRACDITQYVRAQGDFDHGGGRLAAREMFASGSSGCPDAIYCMNDLAAFGVIDELRVMGIKVPEDVMVLGYDNIAMSAWPFYDLSTFDQNKNLIAKTAIAMLGAEKNDPEIIEIPANIIERRSTLRP